jgi:hypothetical protein
MYMADFLDEKRSEIEAGDEPAKFATRSLDQRSVRSFWITSACT